MQSEASRRRGGADNNSRFKIRGLPKQLSLCSPFIGGRKGPRLNKSFYETWQSGDSFGHIRKKRKSKLLSGCRQKKMLTHAGFLTAGKIREGLRPRHGCSPLHRQRNDSRANQDALNEIFFSIMGGSFSGKYQHWIAF